MKFRNFSRSTFRRSKFWPPPGSSSVITRINFFYFYHIYHNSNNNNNNNNNENNINTSHESTRIQGSSWCQHTRNIIKYYKDKITSCLIRQSRSRLSLLCEINFSCRFLFFGSNTSEDCRQLVFFFSNNFV